MQICPNPGFMKQLRHYEDQIKDISKRRSTPEQKIHSQYAQPPATSPRFLSSNSRLTAGNDLSSRNEGYPLPNEASGLEDERVKRCYSNSVYIKKSAKYNPE